MSFAAPGDRNVTVILGENGAGKSTLLNAFRWCLYGVVELENPGELLSHHAVYNANIGAHISVESELQFEHQGQIYTAFRVRQFEKADGGCLSPVGEEVFDVKHTATNGETKTILDPKGFIANFLPENLSKFFFFQGESILQLALQRSRQALQEGVEAFLDFTVLDSAISHLDKAENEFERELRNSGQADVLAIQAKIDQTKKEREGLNEQLQQIQRNILANRADSELKKQRLAEIEQFRPFLQEVSKQEILIGQLSKQRLDAVRELCETISGDGFLGFSQTILSTPSVLADAAIEKGELPAKIKPKFVEDLLERGECICGEKVTPAMHAKLSAWRLKTGFADLEDSISNLRGKLHIFGNKKQDFLSALPKRREQIAKIDDQIREAHERKSRAEREVRNVNLEEQYIKDLQSSYEALKEALITLKVDEARANDAIAQKAIELEKYEKERVHLTKSLKKEQVIARRIEASKHVRTSLTQIRKDWSTLVQGYLDEQLKKTWKQVAQLPRRVTFNPDFSLAIEERGGSGEWVTSAPSEANYAVLALTFVSALISFAKEVGRDPDRDGQVFAGGDFPLVMDAPFAKMDVEFKEKVPVGLAEVVPQVVIISSLDQWLGEVEHGVDSAVGKAYVLTLHKPGDADEARTITAFRRKVPYVVAEKNAFSDWSEIKEVKL